MKRVYSIIVVLLAALSVTLPQSVDAAAPTKASAPAKSTVPAKKGTKAQPPSAVGQLLEAIRKRGTIVVGIAPQVPWVIRDPAGEWQGYEIDVARQLASDLGVELALVRVPFVQLTDALADVGGCRAIRRQTRGDAQRTASAYSRSIRDPQGRAAALELPERVDRVLESGRPAGRAPPLLVRDARLDDALQSRSGGQIGSPI